jgi:serine/threonine protein kinase
MVPTHFFDWLDSPASRKGQSSKQGHAPWFKVQEDILLLPIETIFLANIMAVNESESEEWFIEWDRIELGDKLGEGAYGEVFRAEWAGLCIAAKKLKGAIAPDDIKEEFETEVETLKKLRHPTILLFMGITQDTEGNWYILSEFADAGSLDAYLAKNAKKLSWATKTRFISDISLALAYLHENGCLHRDLKAENVLVNQAGVCKVADFGLARMFSRREQSDRDGLKATRGIGSLWWRAPEVDDPSKEYTAMIDVFSFGIVVAEVLTDGEPGDEIRLSGTTQDPHEKLKWIFDSERLRPMLRRHSPPEALVDMVVQCCRNEPSQRMQLPRIVQVAKHVHTVVLRIEAKCADKVARHFASLAFKLLAPAITLDNLGAPSAPVSALLEALSDMLKERTGRSLDASHCAFLLADIATIEQQDKEEEEEDKEGGSSSSGAAASSSSSPSSTFSSRRVDENALLDVLQRFAQCEAILLNPRIAPLFKTHLIDGFVGKDEAVAQASSAPVGAIVVRFSSRPGSLAITYRRPDGVSHALVRVTDDGIAAGALIFPTFGDMLDSKLQYKFVAPDQPLSKWADEHRRLNARFSLDQQGSYEQIGGEDGAAALAEVHRQMIQSSLSSAASKRNSLSYYE